MSPAEFEAIYRRCAPLVHARARRILGSEADDIVQETFIRFWRRPPAHADLTAWLYRTSTNACLDRLRVVQRRSPAWQREAGDAIAAASTASIVDLLASKDLCRRLIVRADDKTRQVVALVYFDELTYDDTAAILRISRKTVGERIERFHELARKVVQRWQAA